MFKWVKNLVYWPDVYIGWVPVAAIKSISLIKKEKIKLIYLVSPPHSSTFTIFFIKIFTRAKVIVDFRDPWSDDVDIVNPTILHKKLRAISEKLIYVDLVKPIPRSHWLLGKWMGMMGLGAIWASIGYGLLMCLALWAPHRYKTNLIQEAREGALALTPE